MKINEFLNELKLALEGEIPANEVSSNLHYYESYMKEKLREQSEEEVTASLGDPRLIARTIIETYQLSHGSEKHYQSYTDETAGERIKEEDKMRYRRNQGFRVFNMPGWLLTTLVILILMVVFSLVFWIGGIVIRLLFRFGLPIILIFLGISLIRNRRR